MDPIAKLRARENDVRAELDALRAAGGEPKELATALAAKTSELRSLQAEIDTELSKERASKPAEVTVVPQARETLYSQVRENTEILDHLAKGELRNTAELDVRLGLARSAQDIYADNQGGATGSQPLTVPAYDPTIYRAGLPLAGLLDRVVITPTDATKIVVTRQVSALDGAKVKAKRVGSGSSANFGKIDLDSTSFERVEFTDKTVANAVRTDKETLEDAPEVERIFNEQLPASVKQELKRQMLAPTQNNANLTSMVAGANVSGISGSGATRTLTPLLVEYDIVADDLAATAKNMLAAVRSAKKAIKLKCEAVTAGRSYAPTFVAFSDEADEAIDIFDPESDNWKGEGPFGPGRASVFRLERLVESGLNPSEEDRDAGNLGDVIVGSFGGYELKERRGLRVETSENVDDDFLREAVTFKVAGRYISKVIEPRAICVVRGRAAAAPAA